MKLKLTLLFLILSISIFAQTNLGIGLVAIKFDDKTVLPLIIIYPVYQMKIFQ